MTTIIELAQPFVGLSCRSQAKTDRRDSVFFVGGNQWYYFFMEKQLDGKQIDEKFSDRGG